MLNALLEASKLVLNGISHACKRKTGIDSRDLSLVVIFAALYAGLVYVFASISFYWLQLRIAGAIRPAIAKKWVLSFGYAIGIVLGNLISPFAGIYELLFMPIIGFVAGLLGYVVARRFKGSYFVAGVIIAAVVSGGLSVMFHQLLGLPIAESLVYISISEQSVCLIGASVFAAIEKRYTWW
jgi:hypothetical protein